MSKTISDIKKYQNAVTNFITATEILFDNDWENRERFLVSYKKLKEILKEQEISICEE